MELVRMRERHAARGNTHCVIMQQKYGSKPHGLRSCARVTAQSLPPLADYWAPGCTRLISTARHCLAGNALVMKGGTQPRTMGICGRRICRKKPHASGRRAQRKPQKAEATGGEKYDRCITPKAVVILGIVIFCGHIQLSFLDELDWQGLHKYRRGFAHPMKNLY